MPFENIEVTTLQQIEPTRFHYPAAASPHSAPISSTENSDTLLIQQIKVYEFRLRKLNPAIFVLDESGCVVYWNEACEKLTKMDAEAVLGTRNHQYILSRQRELQLADVIMSNNLRELRQHFPQAKHSSLIENGFWIKNWFQPKAGEQHYFQVHAGEILDDQRNSVGVMELIFEKTARKTELEPAGENFSWKDWLHKMNYVAIQTLTPNGRIKDWNTASEKLFNISPSQAQGRFFQGLLLIPTEIPLFECFIKDIVSSKQPTVPMLWRMKTPDGQIRSVYTILTPLIENGRCREISSMCLDFTPHQNVSRALQETEQKYRALFENATDLLALIDSKGQVLSINQAFAEFLDFPVHQLERMNVDQLLTRKDIQSLYQQLRAVVRHKTNTSMEFCWKKRDGSLAYLEIKLQLVNENGNRRNILVIAHDSTAYRLLEKDMTDTYHQVIDTLVDFIDTKDIYTGKHSQRLVKDCVYLANELELNRKEIKDLEVAAILHDVGKIKIPRSILGKIGTLSEPEKEILHTHAEIGAEAVQKIPRFYRISKIIKHHHERYDGTGYPTGLTGKEIPCEARILAVVDAFDAMMSDRPYRKSLGIGVSFRELKKGKATQFDPDVVEAYLEFLKRKYHVDENGMPDYI
jgi:PAS domain S-box-containing protein/putative nucleotidyltransferase with HDIG domain